MCLISSYSYSAIINYTPTSCSSWTDLLRAGNSTVHSFDGETGKKIEK